MSSLGSLPSPDPPRPLARPLLVLDRDDLRLSSPRGAVAAGAVTVTNRGEAPLEGTAVVRVGEEWLRVEPSTLRLQPGESRRVEAHADPSAFAPGYTRGEIEIVSNGGAATLPVRLGVRTGRSWRLLVAALAASALVASGVGVLLAGVKLPSGGATIALPHLPVVSAHQSRAHQRPAPLPSFNHQAALASLRSAIVRSNAVWQTAMMQPATAALASAKTGADLAGDLADVSALLAGGEHWAIDLQRFQILAVGVSDDDASGWGAVLKTERRALYGPGHEHTPYELSDDTYRLRYHLLRQNGRWLVDAIAVQSVTPVGGFGGPTLTVQQVAQRVLPAVMHVRVDTGSGTDVGTGIVVRSSAIASYVLTNNHVVDGANTIRLQRWVGDHFEPRAGPWIAAKWWTDPADDLAVIRIDQGNLPVATWGNSGALQTAQPVVAIGYAEDLPGGPTVTDGIVSNPQRTSPDAPSGLPYIQHSATINPGNSGGPLVDMSGRIVGINTWTLNNTQGLFFAIPSSRAARVAAGFIGSNG